MEKLLPIYITDIFRFCKNVFCLRSGPNNSFQKRKQSGYFVGFLINLLCIVLILSYGANKNPVLVSPLVTQFIALKPLTESKSSHEVFGFAPYWTFDKLQNVDFRVLTTLAYFDVTIDGNGDIDKNTPGYSTFHSDKATELFKTAHANGTRVVLTVTQMQNSEIIALMDNPSAQERAITTIVEMVKKRGIDGVNIDFEYTGNPGPQYREKFTTFVRNMSDKMHSTVSDSKVTVSVYASSVRHPKIYDVKNLASITDGIFMMAYDFAVAGADNAMPTAPLYGHKEGKYWYDIATAVDDFLTEMPANKLILGLPWYGYNYLVYEPAVKAETRPYYSWRGKPATQTYSIAKNNIKPDMEGIDAYKTGWDDAGKVGWIAYHVIATDTWRMLFLDDVRSLSEKYKFAKERSLGGVGMWALGFDDGKQELWTLLEETFGTKRIADNRIIEKQITNTYE